MVNPGVVLTRLFRARIAARRYVRGGTPLAVAGEALVDLIAGEPEVG